MKTILTSILIACTCALMAQPTVTVEVSADTVRQGDLVELTYTIENGQGKFVPPDLSAMPLVSGPNTSSSMMYANGKMSSSQSYSYILRPEEKGLLQIPEASYIENSDTIRLQPKPIIVGGYFPVSPGADDVSNPSTIKREKRKF